MYNYIRKTSVKRFYKFFSPVIRGLGLWCLTPHSTIFQQNAMVNFSGLPGEMRRPVANHWQISHIIIAYIIYKIKVMFLQNWYLRQTSLLITGRHMLCSMSVRKCIRFSIPELQS
jgi:hypothetical protein